ncbi:MAG TPA: FAD-binding oxidoreductase [Candidatus Acidoferrales bacterium]|nr:FAD-binding oxidoreductase [Candidatus Acidoferrales bacterium]
MLDGLGRAFRGEVIAPADAGYDDARRLWNAIHERRPALIVRPTNPADVGIAIRYGRDHDLPIAVKSGGHSAAGHSGCDGGLVIDMAALRGVMVDPERRTARANGGALLRELDTAAQAHGLVCPVGVIGHTGVAGLTLGGGMGRLERKFGLTIDNLLGVQLVTADGRVVRASATEEPELFWGIRGAGPNFGVVTSFDFALQPFAGVLHRGIRFYAGSQVHDVWAMLREVAPTMPDEVALIVSIGRAEPASEYPEAIAGKPIVVVGYNHCGAADDVERDMAPLERGPRPASTTGGSLPYLQVQAANDDVMGWGHRTYISGGFLDDLRPEALDALVELAARAPGEASFALTCQGGALGRVPDDATAFTGRGARFEYSADTSWEDPADDAANIAWVREAMAAAAPDAVTGRYVNEIVESGPAETRAIYGDAKLARLTALKRAWDPDNVFRLNHNIAP